MCKRTLLLREVIGPYHNYFRRNSSALAHALRHPRRYNIEFLVEETFAHVGAYDYMDAAHYDFSDFSDSKTASIRVNPVREGSNSYAGEISGVTTAGGTVKQGSLRCVIYNPHTEQLMYYLLPKSYWQNHITRHPTSGVGKIMFTYNRVQDTIPKFEQYRLRSFRQLALG